jgi:exopolyphosphatase/guanosine-5'-triphosphate,3'-diphosphate pyrophosphatase
MFKISAIDVGSNAMRMVVGDVNENWKVTTLENIRIPVRLGGDVFSKGYLEKITIQRAEKAFLHFKRVAETHNVHQLRAVATSAVREAMNRNLLVERFCHVNGVDLEIISGEEEARLIHLAVLNELKLTNRRILLIDIGGGSVEVTLSNGRNIISTDSYNMGTVRLLEKLNGNKSKPAFGKIVREYAEAAHHRIERDLGDEKIQVCAGTGGNVEEIGRLRQKLFKGESDRLITLSELDKLIERLEEMSISERISELDLRPDRADVILPAAIVLYLVTKQAGSREIFIPGVGLKDGVLLDLAETLSKREHPKRLDQIRESALYLGKKYQFDERHAFHTARFAVRLFEQTRSLHELDDNELLLLEMAALLHDIGYFINTVDHEKHAFYLLNANRLIGLSQREQSIIANLVRYHRKRAPSAEDENFKSLTQKDRIIVLKLTALLRLADSLDVSHSANVDNVILAKTRSGWCMRIAGKDELLLERWSLAKSKSLFEEVFGMGLELD